MRHAASSTPTVWRSDVPAVKTVDDGMTLHPTDRASVALYAPAEWLPRLKAEERGRHFMYPIGTADQSVWARVDAGRWIVDCPGCPSSQWVTWTDPRFYCTECENCKVMGRWIAVEFPDVHLRQEAERVLMVRPPSEQFWFPERESTIHLMGENVGTLNLAPFEGF